MLPLLPGCVGYLSGTAGVTTFGSRLVGAPQAKVRDGRLVAGVLLFVAGFTAVFVVLGTIFAWLGVLLAPWLDLTTCILGGLVVLMGLAFMGYVPHMQRDRRLRLPPPRSVGRAAARCRLRTGLRPCMGPTLAAVLGLAFSEADPARGGVLVLAYSLGLGIPFIAGAMPLSRSTRDPGFLCRHRRTFQRLGGGLLVPAMVTGLWAWVSGYLQGLVADVRTLV